MQRSVSPLGRPYEIEHNHNGFRFDSARAGALVIAELGIRRPPAPGVHQIWVRIGAFDNGSAYTRFDGRGTAANQVVYAAGDLQLSQLEPARPAAGFYVGASAFWGDPSVNTYTQSYETRTYAIGMLHQRPKDTISLKVTYNVFSPAARRAQSSHGIFTNGNQINVSAAYSAHVINGCFLIPSLSYIRHPSFVGDFKDAVLLSSTFYFLL